MANYLLEMKNITKTFPGVKALSEVNLQVEQCEILISMVNFICVILLMAYNGLRYETCRVSGLRPYPPFKPACREVTLENPVSMACFINDVTANSSLPNHFFTLYSDHLNL